MGAKPINEVGNVYGRLTVLKRGQNLNNGRLRWLCLCSCGKETLVRGIHLRKGTTKSCGCLALELTSKRATTHGLCEHRLYNTWVSMIHRCEDPKRYGYKDYGGRGITVCEEWHDVSVFIEWGEPRFKEGLQLDRRNNEGNYEPSNCRFTTRSINALNQRMNSNNTSGYRGVDKCRRGQFSVRIANNKKKFYVGKFDTALEAAIARDKFIDKHGFKNIKSTIKE